MLSISKLHSIRLLNEWWNRKDMKADSWPHIWLRKTMKTPQSGQPVTQLRFKSSTFQIQVYSSTSRQICPVQCIIILSECILDHKILGWGNNSDFSPEKVKNYPLIVIHGHYQTQWFSSEKWWCHITTMECFWKLFSIISHKTKSTCWLNVKPTKWTRCVIKSVKSLRWMLDACTFSSYCNTTVNTNCFTASIYWIDIEPLWFPSQTTCSPTSILFSKQIIIGPEMKEWITLYFYTLCGDHRNVIG
jgi:hypothetical protein